MDLPLENHLWNHPLFWCWISKSICKHYKQDPGVVATRWNSVEKRRKSRDFGGWGCGCSMILWCPDDKNWYTYCIIYIYIYKYIYTYTHTYPYHIIIIIYHIISYCIILYHSDDIRLYSIHPDSPYPGSWTDIYIYIYISHIFFRASYVKYLIAGPHYKDSTSPPRMVWSHVTARDVSNTMEIFIKIWLVVWNMTFMTFHILGMSSSQLTNSYFSEGLLNHQPEICFFR